MTLSRFIVTWSSFFVTFQGESCIVVTNNNHDIEEII